MAAHRSHLCHGCGHIWRPADVPTNGVAAVKTKGKADSPTVTTQPAAPAPAPTGKREAPMSRMVATAPERIWLNIFTEGKDADFPANHEDITWAEDVVGDSDVEYVRADLARPAAPAQQAAAPQDGAARMALVSGSATMTLCDGSVMVADQMPSAAPQAPTLTGDMARQIARSARTSASDDAGPMELVAAGWNAAVAAGAAPQAAELTARNAARYEALRRPPSLDWPLLVHPVGTAWLHELVGDELDAAVDAALAARAVPASPTQPDIQSGHADTGEA